MNKVFRKTAAVLMSVAMAFSALPSSFAAVSTESDTSYSIQQKSAARLGSASGGTYAAVLRSDKVGNDAQTTTTAGYSQQVETKLSEASGNVSATYFEQDKYISDPTGEKNGQSTYNITIENAYVGAQIENVAPDGQDIVIIEDASSSMSGHTDTQNEAVANLITKIHDVNTQRVDAAMDGRYSASINPSGKTRAQVQQEMIDGGHLIRLVGIEAFNASTTNKYGNKTYLLTDSDVRSAISSAKVYSSDLQDLTRTDYAMKDITSKYGYISSTARTTIILLTDGAPYDWNNSVANGYLMSSGASNSALDAANSLKAQGATIYSIFMPWDANGDSNMYEDAVLSADINKLTKNGKVDPDGNMAAVFMSLLSSDYASGHLNTASGSHMFNNTFSCSSNGNGFGKFSKYVWDTDTIITSIAAIAKKVDSATYAQAQVNGGYASVSSYVLDDISHPFELDGLIDDIKVYQVPRVPKSLDATGHPADASNVTAFTWGEREDITDQVDITLEGNRIQVTGYNYEANALTTYDHDLALSADKQGSDPTAYKAGDYGYKLVVEFPIRAKFSFGGNDIETNDSTTSGFYPSTPGKNSGKTAWTGNTSLNPSGSKYVALYPVPIVDLKVNYAINGSNQYIYAPQTAKMLNIVTNETNSPSNLSIFNTGETQDAAEKYFTARTEYIGAQSAYEAAKKNFDKAYAKYSADSTNESLVQAMMNAQDALYAAKDDLTTKENTFSGLAAYIPDGTNNAYVDITYTLTSPSGKVIGSMNIPHGTALNDMKTDNTGNIKWTFTDGDDMIITEDGTYKINCTVTPVATTRAESYTGSSAADDTLQPENYSKSPVAHLYQLQITMKDTAKKPGSSLDFMADTNENVFDAAKSSDWQEVHWVETKWISIDGHTASDPKNEPGNAAAKTQAGEAPTGAVSIGDDTNVADIDGSKSVSKTAADNSTIPARISVSRKVGNINKNADVGEQVTMVLKNMSDDDHVFGAYSSIVWKHECDIADNCDKNELATARNNIDGGKTTGQNITRFLIHISDTILPEVDKSTSTPTIDVGGDIQWKVTVRNDNVKENKNHKTTRAQMLDILPYQNDGRENPNNNKEGGSSFGSELYFKTISVDCSSASAMVSAYQNGSAKLYYTTNKAVRTATREQWYSGTTIQWTEATPSISGNTVSFSVPQDAVAIKSDTTLSWNEKIVFNLTANVKDTSLQKTHDVYINQALVGNDDSTKASDPVVTELVPVAITGTIWYDNNGNGQMDGSEERAAGITVSLYKDWSNASTDHITLSDRNLEKVYNAKEELVSSYVTGSNGYFEFNNLPAGKYYVVATGISADYNVTDKQKSGTDNALNSKAEKSMPAGQTAWIKDIYVGSSSVPYQNIGLVVQKGTVTITKVMENGKLYSTASMTDEQKKALSKNFVFNLKNNNTGMEYSASVVVDRNNVNGVSATFEELPLGTYTLSETTSLGYEVASMDVIKGNVQYSSVSKTATIYISAGETDVDITVNNRTTETDPGVYPGSGVINHVGTALPIAFKVTYTHGDINDQNAVSYTFKQSDFANMKVTYDDGTYRDFTGTYKINVDGTTSKVGDNPLRFDEVTITPATVTNERNTTDSGNKISINVYFSERNKTLSDMFTVGVNLKPLHKFTAVFHANGTSFGGASDTNSVRFSYNDTAGKNDIISGVYREPDGHAGWTFAGWNTASDGSGVNYASLTALNEIGANQTNVTSVDLYAHWTTTVTFGANGGTLTGGTTATEQAMNGQASGTATVRVGGKYITNMTATRSGYSFVEWNTSPDGTGTELSNLTITSPVTVYAVWAQNAKLGGPGVRTYTASVAGTYKITIVGAAGASQQTYGPGGGGTTQIVMHLSYGQTLYFGLGAWGYTGDYDYRWNGGGRGSEYGGYYAGNGGGASHIATTNRGELYNYEHVYQTELIAVAGGGGAATRYGGCGYNGNAANSGNNGIFGRGSSDNGGGGGGGFYGGANGAHGYGGSGYVNTAFTTQYRILDGTQYECPGGANGGAVIEFISKG